MNTILIGLGLFALPLTLWAQPNSYFKSNTAYVASVSDIDIDATISSLIASSATANTKKTNCSPKDPISYTQDEFESIMNDANLGNSFAQNELGFYYQSHGENHQAATWYKKSAEQENPSAQNNLAYLYEYGCGVRQDLKQSRRLYTLSAKNGNAVAQVNLGNFILAYNARNKANVAIAKEWYGKACDNGNQRGCDEYRELKQQGY